MADIKSPEARSKNMAAIKGKNTKPEIYLRKKLFSLGFRYRKNSSKILGHPDIWMAKYNVAIFIHGCYWHRHLNCRYAYTPKSRVDFWTKKFSDNITRDKFVLKSLQEQGIRCLVIWECAIRKMAKCLDFENQVIAEIQDFLVSGDFYHEIST